MKIVLIAFCLTVAPLSGVGAQWVASVKQDEITDEQVAVFRTVSLTHTANAIRLPTKPTLIVRCSGAEVSDVIIVVDAYIADMEGDVQLRFDRGTPIETSWLPSSTNEALFSPYTEQFLDSLLTHKKLIFRYYPHRETPQTATFAIPSFAPHRAQAVKFCGFEPVKRLATIAERKRAAAKLADVEAEQRRRDSVEQVTLIELSDPDGVISLAPADTVWSNTLISRVMTREGKEINDYHSAFIIQYPDGRSLSYSGPTLPLEWGTNVVRVFVNGTQADRELRFEMR